MNNWKKISSKVVYENQYFQVKEDEVEKPNKEKGKYFSLTLPQCVIIIPLTQNSEVYLIQIERYTTGFNHWELPHGSSDNEDYLVAAKRELQEESGLVSENWEKIGKQEVANGWTDQLSHIYIARDVSETSLNKESMEGITRVEKIPFKKVLEMIKNGEITESNSIGALTLTALKLRII